MDTTYEKKDSVNNKFILRHKNSNKILFEFKCIDNRLLIYILDDSMEILMSNASYKGVSQPENNVLGNTTFEDSIKEIFDDLKIQY